MRHHHAPDARALRLANQHQILRGLAHLVDVHAHLGQAGNPLHPDGLLAFFAALRGEGFSVSEIERMAKVNPAQLLGLPDR